MCDSSFSKNKKTLLCCPDYKNFSDFYLNKYLWKVLELVSTASEQHVQPFMQLLKFSLHLSKQRAWTQDLLWDQKWGRKGRSKRGKRRSWKRNPERAVGKEGRWETVENGQQKDQSRWVSSPESTTVSKRKQWGKTSQDELAFLVAL